jgi:outer membrane protein
MRFRGWVTVVTGLAALAAVAAPAWAEMKIGVVQYSRLMQESPQGKTAQESLRNEFSGKQKELQVQDQSLKTREEALVRDSATMTPEQRSQVERQINEGRRELSLKANTMQDDFNARQNEELSKLQKTLVEEVQSYAQAQKFDLVLAGDSSVIFASPVLDITSQVLSALQARGARAPAASGPGAAPAAPKGPVAPGGK